MSEVEKILKNDTDGLASYEYLVNHSEDEIAALTPVIDKIIAVDTTGQFVSSAARYLSATEPERYADVIDRLINAAIEKDKERSYLPALLSSIWGEDYMERAEQLRETDDNFRRIYKRVHNVGAF